MGKCGRHSKHLSPHDQHLVVAARERQWTGLARSEQHFIHNRAVQERAAGNTIVARQFEQEEKWDEQFVKKRISIAELHEKAAGKK